MVRVPQQDRSITTREKIVEGAYELFAENGYYNTNTAKIAKQAGVSTGIVYGYFHDKRDLLLEVMDRYIAEVYLPIGQLIDSFTPNQRFDELVANIVQVTISTHLEYAKIHEALHSMSCVDELVRDKFLQLENQLTHEIATKLAHIGIDEVGLTEKVHIAINLVQSLAHEYTYDKHDYINYDILKDYVIELLLDIFGA